ncbi:MAG: hypothetical protein U0835_08150 [Isosphaeraceae bacterium]
MTRPKWLIAVAAAAAFACAALAPGIPAVRAQEPPKTLTEKIKAKAGSAVESIKKGAANASETVREQYAKARGEVSRMGIEARVYARLHWEKALEHSKVELSPCSKASSP